MLPEKMTPYHYSALPGYHYHKKTTKTKTTKQKIYFQTLLPALWNAYS